MVPMLTCGLVRWNFAFATGRPPGLVLVIRWIRLAVGDVAAMLSGGLARTSVRDPVPAAVASRRASRSRRKSRLHHSPVAFALLSARLRARSAPRFRCDAHSPVAFALLSARLRARSAPRFRCDAHSPVAFAIISF